MIMMTAKIKLKEGKEKDFEQIAEGLSEKTHALEPGCSFYRLSRSQTDPQTYISIEAYDDQNALAHHLETDYFKAASPKMQDCFAEPPVVELFDRLYG